jgi:hypothetical protein
MEASMRILNILSGLAVLFTTLAFGHLLHHHFAGAPHDNPVVWAGFAVGAAVGIFSFLGGCLLLRRAR